MITLNKQPDFIHALYSENDYEFTDSTTVDEYKIEVFVSGVLKGTYRVPPNLDNKGTFNPKYLLSNLVFKGFTDVPTDYLVVDMLEYNLKITPIVGGNEQTSHTVGTKYTYNGTEQAYDTYKTQDYVQGRFLNNHEGTTEVLRNDKQTITLINSVEHPVGAVSLVYTYGTGNYTGRTIMIPVPTKPQLVVVNTSYLGSGISPSVSVYRAETDNDSMEFELVEEDNRFKTRRFAYKNQNGATEYVNFNGVNTDSLKIKRNTYINNNTTKVYRTDVDNTLTVRSGYITEERSLDLKPLWYSDVVLLSQDYNTSNVTYPVVLQNTKQEILDYVSGLISYTIEFMYGEGLHIQRN